MKNMALLRRHLEKKGLARPTPGPVIEGHAVRMRRAADAEHRQDHRAEVAHARRAGGPHLRVGYRTRHSPEGRRHRFSVTAPSTASRSPDPERD